MAVLASLERINDRIKSRFGESLPVLTISVQSRNSAEFRIDGVGCVAMEIHVRETKFRNREIPASKRQLILQSFVRTLLLIDF